MRSPLRSQQRSEVLQNRGIRICEQCLRGSNHSERFETRQIRQKRYFHMLNPVTVTPGVIHFGSIFKCIQRHVDRSIADCVQQNLEAYLIVKRDGFVQIILLPKRNTSSAAYVRLKHRGSSSINSSIQNSFDGAELHQRTAKCCTKLFVTFQIPRCQGLRQMMFGRSSLIRWQNRGCETEPQF